MDFEVSSPPVYPFGQDLVKIHAWTPVDAFSEEFPLEVRVEFGATRHEISETRRSGPPRPFRRYRIRVRHCELKYNLSGCEVLLQTKYQYVLQGGQVQSRAELQSTARTENRIKVFGETSARIGDRGASGGARALFGIGRRQDHDQQLVAQAVAHEEIEIIAPIPNGWSIGRVADGTVVRGSEQNCLWSRYFQEPVDGYPTTYIVKFERTAPTADMCFIVRAEAGLHIERLDAGGRPKPEAIGGERAAVIASMRSRIAGLKLEKLMNDLPLAVVKYKVHRPRGVNSSAARPRTTAANQDRKIREKRSRQ